MSFTFLETLRAKLRYIVGTDLVADIDAGFANLAKDVDTKVVSYSQAATGSKPAAGQPNRIWRDTTTGFLYRDTGTEWKRLYIGEAVTTLTAAGPYSAMAAITVNTDQTPSATRPTLVCLTCRAGAKKAAINVRVGGASGFIVAQMAATTASVPQPFTFILRPNEKWRWENAEGSAGAVKASYLTL